MKNKRIIDSWNKIEPDSVDDERMLSAILARNHAGQSEKEKVYPMNKTLNWKRLAPIAACLLLVVTFVGVFGNNAGWFGSKVYTEDLGGGTLNFYKSESAGAASFVWDADWGDEISRELTTDESKTLFGDLTVTGNANFRSTDKALMYFEGKTSNTKIILAANGQAVTDTVVKGNDEVSEINDIPVTAGYFVTKANSQGNKNIIYFASFSTNGTTVYLELGGVETDSETLRTEIGDIIDQLTKNPPDASAVTAE